MNRIEFDIRHFRFFEKKGDFFTDLHFTLSERIYVLVGKSGIGKSTLVKLISGIQEGSFDGDIKYIQSDISHTRKSAQEKGLIGYLSQDNSLIPWKSVKENLSLPCNINSNLMQPTILQIIAILEKVGLSSAVVNSYPHELSFGMKMRVMLARIFLYKPVFIFLDELFTGIDTINSDYISSAIRQYVKLNNCVCFAITHDIDRALNFGEQILYFDRDKKLKTIHSRTRENILQTLEN
jgi:ABC-type nitrate/sulfonate/bicarbonate transport system ATPase subunit